MKTKGLILASVLFTITLLFVACNNDEIRNSASKKAIDKTVNVEYGHFLELSIENGSGGYIVTSSDSVVATAIAESKKLKIKGLKEGSTILTIRDKTQRELRVAVNVFDEDRMTGHTKIEKKD